MNKKSPFSMEVVDAKNHHWKSNAVFIADETGKVDLAKTESIDGSYTGVHAMGLFWSMKSDDYHQIATGKGFNATIRVLLNSLPIKRAKTSD